MVSGWVHDCRTYLYPLHSGVTSWEDGVVVWFLAQAPIADFTCILHPFRLSCVSLSTWYMSCVTSRCNPWLENAHLQGKRVGKEEEGSEKWQICCFRGVYLWDVGSCIPSHWYCSALICLDMPCRVSRRSPRVHNVHFPAQNRVKAGGGYKHCIQVWRRPV